MKLGFSAGVKTFIVVFWIMTPSSLVHGHPQEVATYKDTVS
jgi:hypothetical protein